MAENTSKDPDFSRADGRLGRTARDVLTLD